MPGTLEVDRCNLQREEVFSCRQPFTTCLSVSRLMFGDGGPTSPLLIQIHTAPEDANQFVSKWVYFSVEGCFDTHVFDGTLVPSICYRPLPVQISSIFSLPQVC